MDVYTEKWKVVIPNKLFEYLACGLPILACNARASAEYMEGSGAVLSARSMSQLIEKMNDTRNWLEMSDAALRSARYMDDEITKLLSLHDLLAGVNVCDICGASIKTPSALKAHVRRGHPDQWEAWSALRDEQAK
jgi:hypothetical protein